MLLLHSHIVVCVIESMIQIKIFLFILGCSFERVKAVVKCLQDFIHVHLFQNFWSKCSILLLYITLWQLRINHEVPMNRRCKLIHVKVAFLSQVKEIRIRFFYRLMASLSRLSLVHPPSPSGVNRVVAAWVAAAWGVHWLAFAFLEGRQNLDIFDLHFLVQSFLSTVVVNRVGLIWLDLGRDLVPLVRVYDLFLAALEVVLGLNVILDHDVVLPTPWQLGEPLHVFLGQILEDAVQESCLGNWGLKDRVFFALPLVLQELVVWL